MEKDSTGFDDRVRLAIGRLCPGQPGSAAEQLSSALAASGVIARVRLGRAREAVLMAALADRLASEPGLRVLVVVPGDRDVASLKSVFDSIDIGFSCSTVGRDGVSEESDMTIGSLDAVATRAAAALLDVPSFGIVALNDVDAMVDAASAVMLRRALGPAASSRRLLAFSAEPGPAHRALARDLGGLCLELELESGTELAKRAPCVTYGVLANDKARLLLGLMKTSGEKPVVVFCNVRGTADDAARRLKAAGLRVDYNPGNPPKKPAILDSVRSGKFDVLLFTDEAAAGLPGAWATTLVNWDLPLEGEPYMARLGCLDPAGAGTRVINFACERYSYGIPAIEQALGAPITIIKVEESMMSPEPEPAMPTRTDRGSGYRSGDDRRDRGGQYDGRNTRSIQADIAAITGGSPQSGVPQGGSQQNGSQQNGNPAERTRQGGDAGKNGTRNESRKKRGRKDRKPAASANSGSRPAPRAQAPSDKAATGTRDSRQTRAPGPGQQMKKGQPVKSHQGSSRPVDPYSVSMEERLRMYRERYGSKSHAGSSGPRVAGRSEPEKKPAPGQTDTGNQGIQKSAQAGTDATGRKKGLVGALRGIFRKKDD